MKQDIQIAVLKFPGTNCEHETKQAIEAIPGACAQIVRWNEAESLQDFDGYILPGGFSYEDRGRSGIIAAQDDVLTIIRAQAKLGKPVLGICNGAQILVETGLVAGLSEGVDIGLARNKQEQQEKVVGTGFYNAWVYIKNCAPKGRTAFTHFMEEGDYFIVPVAHAEGRFITNNTVLDSLKTGRQGVFKYVNDSGNPKNEFPTNPNGSIENYAAICNPEGNVLAIMPHPERCSFAYQLSSNKNFFAEGPGLTIFASMVHHCELLKAGKLPDPFVDQSTIQKSAETCIAQQQSFEVSDTSAQLIVDLIITDDAANTVMQALVEKFPQICGVRRSEIWTVWPIPNHAVCKQLIQSGELLNTNKQSVIVNMDGFEHAYVHNTQSFKPAHTTASPIQIRIRDNDGDDMIARSKKSNLAVRHGIPLLGLIREIMWTIDVVEGTDADCLIHDIIKSNIVHNPYAHQWVRGE